ncbi:MAG: hypothetical protein J6Y26_06470 [Lachnospiraceae bacterium]|nr:hypothetical protein [Lachnospiraceae bacterium]
MIEADATADQELTITAGEATTTEAVTPSTKNRIEVPSMLWNFGDDTVITLSKGGTDAGAITIHFPAAIDTDAALNETETDNEFTLQGSASVQDQIVSLQESVERVSAQTLAYILPSAVDQSGIADGSSNTVETFDFEAGAENVKVAFFTCIQFLATTTVTAASAYEDLDITVTLTLDGNPIATILQAYRDGRQVLTLNHLIENLSKGNHTLTVAIAAAGGSVSVMQIVAAYLLTAKSTGAGTSTIYSVFDAGAFEPGVLADGFDVRYLTPEAEENGTIYQMIKKSESSEGSRLIPNVSTLSQYFLSIYCLMYCLYDSTPLFIDNDVITRDRDTVASDAAFYIPIKRVSGYTLLVYEGKNEFNNTPECVLGLTAAAIVNGNLIHATYSFIRDQTTWGTFSVDISALPHVDYLRIYMSEGKPQYKNIRLVKNS